MLTAVVGLSELLWSQQLDVVKRVCVWVCVYKRGGVRVSGVALCTPSGQGKTKLLMV